MNESPRTSRARPLTAFGREVHRLLDERGLMPAALSAHLKRDRRWLHHITVGLRPPTPPIVNRVAKFFKLTPDQTIALHRAAAESRGYQLGPAPAEPKAAPNQ